MIEGTIVGIADEIASAVDLVTGKSKNLPVAIVRGLAHYVTVEDGPGAASMVRSPEGDMFRLGTNEAWDEGYRAGLQAGEHHLPHSPTCASQLIDSGNTPRLGFRTTIEIGLGHEQTGLAWIA